MAKKFAAVAFFLAAMVLFEYFAANVSAYALNELTRYQLKNMVALVSVAFIAVDISALAMLADKNPNAGSGYLLAAWFLAITMRAALIWQGLAFGFAAMRPEWLVATIAPVVLAVIAWLHNVLLVWLASKAFRMLGGRSNGVGE